MKKSLIRLTALGLALSGLAQFTSPVRAQLPHLGDDEAFSIHQERKMGDQIAQLIYKDADYLDDPILVDYVQSLWQPLLQAARIRGDLQPDQDTHFDWALFVARDPAFNAFATYGGNLAINTGLIERTQHRSQVAGVLAHEIAHVTQRHLARHASLQNRQQPLVLAAMLLGAAFITRNPELANAAIVGGQAASIQSQINYTRDMEREADRIGYAILTQARFEPQGMVSMFQIMERASRLNDSNSFPYLRTHPLTTDRMADADNRAQQDASGANPLAPDTWAQIMALRAKLLSGKSTDTLREAALHPGSPLFSSQTQESRLSALYGATLALHLLHRPQQAQSQYDQLLSMMQAPRQVDALARQTIVLLGLEISLAGDASADVLRQRLQAWQLDSAAHPSTVLARSGLLLSAQAWIRLRQPGRAAESLRTWLSAQPRDAQAWRLLALAQRQQGALVQAIRSDAEAQAAELDYVGAHERLQAAQKLSDFAHLSEHDQSIFQSRIRRLAELRRSQQDDRDHLRKSGPN